MPLGALEVEILVQVLVGANYDAIMSPSFSCLFYGNYFHLYIANWSFSELHVMPVLPECLICC